MNEAQKLRDQAERYRQLIKSIDDPRVRNVLERMAVECEQKAKCFSTVERGSSEPKTKQEPDQ